VTPSNHESGDNNMLREIMTEWKELRQELKIERAENKRLQQIILTRGASTATESSGVLPETIPVFQPPVVGRDSEPINDSSIDQSGKATEFAVDSLPVSTDSSDVEKAVITSRGKAKQKRQDRPKSEHEQLSFMEFLMQTTNPTTPC